MFNNNHFIEHLEDLKLLFLLIYNEKKKDVFYEREET